MEKTLAEKIKRVKNHADIVQVISSDVSLEKIGNNYYGNCPLCKERKSSLRVSKEKQSAHCYACGVTFDVFGYYQKTKNISFFESVNEVKRFINLQNGLAYKKIQRALLRVDELIASDSLDRAVDGQLNDNGKKSLLKQFAQILQDLLTDYYTLTLEKKADGKTIDDCSNMFKSYNNSLQNEADSVAQTKMRNLFRFLAELCEMIKENDYNLGGMVYFNK